MTSTVGADEDVRLPAPPPPAWRVLRWTALVLCFLTVVAYLLVGVRQDDYFSLQEALRTSAVDEVVVQSHVTDLDEPFPGQGSARLQWRDNGQNHSATVWHAGSESLLPEGDLPDDTVSGVIVGALGPELRALNPDVTLTQQERPSSWGTLGDRNLYGPWAVLPGLLWFLTVLTMITGPEPRWATRWAWFWLLLSPAVFVAVPAYLVWGAHGHEGGRRLTGGWAFLLFLLVSGS